MWIVRVALNRPYTFVVLGPARLHAGPGRRVEHADRHLSEHRHPGHLRRLVLHRPERRRAERALDDAVSARPDDAGRQHRAPRVDHGQRLVDREDLSAAGRQPRYGERAGEQRLAVDAALHAGRDPAAGDHQLQRVERAGAAARACRARAVRAGAERPVVQLPPHPADHRARARSCRCRTAASSGRSTSTSIPGCCSRRDWRLRTC